jgi:hypothetical protein
MRALHRVRFCRRCAIASERDCWMRCRCCTCRDADWAGFATVAFRCSDKKLYRPNIRPDGVVAVKGDPNEAGSLAVLIVEEKAITVGNTQGKDLCVVVRAACVLGCAGVLTVCHCAMQREAVSGWIRCSHQHRHGWLCRLGEESDASRADESAMRSGCRVRLRRVLRSPCGHCVLLIRSE